MIKSLSLIFITALFALATGNVLADPPATSGEEHPCKDIAAKCKAAGFVKGEAAEGKGLWKNCIEPVMEGKTVANVTVSQAEIDACKAKKGHRHHKQ